MDANPDEVCMKVHGYSTETALDIVRKVIEVAWKRGHKSLLHTGVLSSN